MLEVLVAGVVGAAVGAASGLLAAVGLLRLRQWRNGVRIGRGNAPYRDAGTASPLYLPCGIAGAAVAGYLASHVQLLWAAVAAFGPAALLFLLSAVVILRQAYER